VAGVMNENTCGHPSCKRMIPDSTSAMTPTKIAVSEYWIAMTLASWLQMYLPMNVFGW
jgi:hypothetical protein